MDIVHPRVAGIDVHKKVIWVAARLPGERPGERAVTVRRFATFWRQLQKMAAWLAGLGVTGVAMESTGVYWWPVYHGLAGEQIEVCVCDAAHMRNVPAARPACGTASGSPSCTSTGCYGPVSSGCRGGSAAAAHPLPQKTHRAADQRGSAADQGAGIGPVD
jgi:transposase